MLAKACASSTRARGRHASARCMPKCASFKKALNAKKTSKGRAPSRFRQLFVGFRKKKLETLVPLRRIRALIRWTQAAFPSPRGTAEWTEHVAMSDLDRICVDCAHLRQKSKALSAMFES